MLNRAIKDITKGSLDIVGKLFGKNILIAPRHKRKNEVFDLNMLSAYWNQDQEISDYDTSLNHTSMRWSDSISKRSRYYSLHQGVNMVLDRNLEGGDVAECGTWRGHSAHMIATLLENRNFPGKFHLFDSFEGLSDLAPQDTNERWVLSPSGVKAQKDMLAATEDTVRGNLSEFGFIEYHAGWIPTMFPEVEDRKFIFVHLDVDLYEPYQDSINFFYPRLVEGGVMAFDDYGLTQFPGAKTAVDEAIETFNPNVFYRIPTGGAFLIK